MLYSFYKGKIAGLAMFWETTYVCMKLVKAEYEVNQQEGEEEFKCYIVSQMIVAMLRSNGQGVVTQRSDIKHQLCSRRLLLPTFPRKQQEAQLMLTTGSTRL